MSRDAAVIFDLEFTAWEGSMRHRWLRPGEFKEVVQIGAVKVDAETLTILDSFNIIVRPRINSRLSAYLEDLTGITNEAVKAYGRDFVEAYDRFLDFARGASISAFGRDDLVLTENLRLYGIGSAGDLPLFLDARPWFRANGFDTRGLHSCDIGPRLGVPFSGRKHNALDDSRSIAQGMKVLIERGARSLFA
ncbi:MAG: exonuclease domain-containing protein [Rhizomicrobium sp.]